MKMLIIGNALCFVGSIIMTLIGLIKKKRNFLAAQSAMNAVFICGNLCLGGISGAVANAVTMLRNFVCLKYNMTKILKIVFIALQLGLTAAFGVNSIILWLPVIGACVFTWFMDTEDMVLLKAIIVASQIMWGIYDFKIMNYVTVPFDAAAAVTNTIAMISLIRAKKETETQEQ